MAHNRTIDTRLFKDRWVRSLSPLDKLLFIYLLTNISTNIAGAYEIELDDVSLDTGLTASEIDAALARFEADGKAFYKDGWMYVANFIKHQSYRNEKIKDGILKIVNGCPNWVKNLVLIGYQTKIDNLSHLILFNSIQSNERRTEEEAAPAVPPDTEFEPERFDHPAVVEFESVFGFTPGSGFATSVARKVKHPAIWTSLLDNKRAYADKPIKERKKVCDWILDAYDERVTATPKVKKLPTGAELLAQMEADRGLGWIHQPPAQGVSS